MVTAPRAIGWPWAESDARRWPSVSLTLGPCGGRRRRVGQRAKGEKIGPRVANVGDDAALFAVRDRTLFNAPVAEDDEPRVVVGHRARFAVMVMVR